MASASLLPLLGVAGIGLARAATTAVSDGLSFVTELARGLDENTDTAAQPTAADERREQLQRKIEALATRIKQQLAAAGIDISQPLTLSSDGLGGITTADHPQRAAIEELLESDVLLLRDFERLKDEFESAGNRALGSEFHIVVAEATVN